MRILLTTDTIGGVWTFTQELLAELLRRGHSIALLSFGRAPSDSQSKECAQLHADYAEAFWCEASEAPLEWMDGNERAYGEGCAALLALAESFRPDLVHSSQFCFGCLPLSLPVVITAHSDVLSWAAACRPQGLEPSAWLTCYRSLVGRGLRCAAAVVAPTQWMSDALCEMYSVASPPEVILNGRSLTLGRGSSKLRQAVCVGRIWDEAKNLKLLTETHVPLPILVAGERCFEGTQAVAKSGQVRLLGPLAEEEILKLFDESDFYIAPSIYEPFGLAPLEAAQCGCALLLRDLSSFREIWGDAALYFEDAASLDQLVATLSSESIRKAQRQSQERARQLTGARMADQYEALYRRLLAGSTCGLKELAAHGC